jgi:hypothetical protein
MPENSVAVLGAFLYQLPAETRYGVTSCAVVESTPAGYVAARICRGVLEAWRVNGV